MQHLINRQLETTEIRHAAFHGCTLWLTGFSGAGKTSIATFIKDLCTKHNVPNYMLDGDVIRQGLCSDLGFSNNDRKENIRRIGEVSRLMADAGVICIVAFISPFQKDRDFARQLHVVADLRFLEIHVDTPIEICKKRDTKGLYAKAERGEIKGLTGIDAPYEEPNCPEVCVKTVNKSVKECSTEIFYKMKELKIITSNLFDKFVGEIKDEISNETRPVNKPRQYKSKSKKKGKKKDKR